MKKDIPKFRFTLGSTSLSLLLLAASSFLPAALWSSQPQYQGPAGMGVGFLMGFLVFFLWLPILIVAFVTGGMAIANDRGRKSGMVTVGSILLAFFWLIIQNGWHH